MFVRLVWDRRKRFSAWPTGNGWESLAVELERAMNESSRRRAFGEKSLRSAQS